MHALDKIDRLRHSCSRQASTREAMQRILHPTDFSASASRALATAERLARPFNGEIILIHVAMETALFGHGRVKPRELLRFHAALRRGAMDELRRRARRLRRRGLRVRWRLRVGDVHRQIVQAAKEERADLIVMGTRGRGGLSRLLLGSLAERVVRLAPCPVVTVRAASV